jgi:hypothetical protein
MEWFGYQTNGQPSCPTCYWVGKHNDRYGCALKDLIVELERRSGG